MNLDENQLKAVVIETLNIPENEYTPTLSMGEHQKWDSLTHISLIFALEDAFQLRFETDEIPQIKSLAQIRTAIEKRRA